MAIPVLGEDGGVDLRPTGVCDKCGQEVRRRLDDPFPTVLARLLKSHSVTDYEIEKITGVGHEYISRLRRGLKHAPSKDTVARIVFALARHGLYVEEADRLFEAAGYASPYRQKYRDDPVEDGSA